MHWCPSVGVTFQSSSTDEGESGTTVRFSSTTSDREFSVQDALIHTAHIRRHIQETKDRMLLISHAVLSLVWKLGVYSCKFVRFLHSHVIIMHIVERAFRCYEAKIEL